MKKSFVLAVFLMLSLFAALAQENSNSQQKNDATDSFYSEESLPTPNITMTVNNGKVYQQGKRLYKKDVIKILDYNPEIKANFLKGEQLRTNGNTLLTFGIIGSTAGIAMMFSGINYDAAYNEDIYEPKYYIGLLVGVLGEVMIAGGIATSIIGKNKVKHAVIDHNNAQSGIVPLKPQPNLNIGFMANGIGVRLNF